MVGTFQSQFISLQQASDHLRRDTTDDNADLLLKVQAASSLVANYLGTAYIDAAPFLDTAGEVLFDTFGDPIGVPREIQAATLLMVDALYNQNSESTAFEQGYLPKPVTALLYPLRDPALA